MAQDAYGLQRADIARVLPVALSYVASSLVEPRPRIQNLRVYASTLSCMLRSSARSRSHLLVGGEGVINMQFVSNK